MRLNNLVAFLFLVPLALALCVVVVGQCADNDDDDDPAGPVPPVSVTLLGTVDQIAGLQVPPGLAQQHTEYLRIRGQSDVTLTLPDGQTLRLRAKYASVNVQYGTVVDVHLLPLARSVPYKEAVAELHRILGVLNIEPDARMKGKMREWPEDSPGFDPASRPGFYPLKCRAETRLSAEVVLIVELRPGGNGGWFIAMSFASDGPGRRALRDRYPKPQSTQPSAGGA